ncbi:MAG TPA: hypothetical protein VF981_08845 [Gemmatimonadaceae bacterium]
MRGRTLVIAFLASSGVSGSAWGQDPARDGSGIAARAVLDPREDMVFRAMTIPDTVWVGQQATYQVGVFLSDEIRSRLRRNPVFVPPELRSMLAYDLAGVTSPARVVGPRRYEVHVFQRALFPLTAGVHEIPPSRLEYALPLSNSFFAREESHSARTQGLVVVAREPPSFGRPVDYKGAVGRLSLETRFDGRGIRTGNPFTYTVVVLGVGNVSLLPRPEFTASWADIVPGAVRVQMDSTTTLVRGRKEFDWIVTPLQPGPQSVPATRYPYFNPYTEQYEVALSRAQTVSVTGTPVVVDREAADGSPVLAIRRVYEGQVPEPITRSGVFWLMLSLAPVPFILLLFVGRPARARAPERPERQLLEAARSGGADSALVRRIFAGGVASRVLVTPADMADGARFVLALRRAGVSDGTAHDAGRLLRVLDAAVFGGQGDAGRGAAERAASLLRAIDDEARSRAALSARRAGKVAGVTAAMAVALLTSAFGPIPSSVQLPTARNRDLVASTVFANGLAAFDAREFGSARQAFYELAQARPRAADAWFNFGTASWQLQDTAAAVIGWQRALRLQPMVGDARDRLRLAPGRPRPWHGIPPLTLTAIGLIGGTSWVAGCLLFAVARRRPRVILRRGGTSLVAVAVLCLVGGLAQQEILQGRNTSVVLSATHLRDVPVLSGDAGVEAQSGEVVRIMGRQGAWTRIELSDRRQGWVEARRLADLDVEGGRASGWGDAR